MSSLRQSRGSTRIADIWCNVTGWCSIRLENEPLLGYLLLLPTMITVLGLIGYPFLTSIFYSFTNKTVGQDTFTFTRDPIVLTTYIERDADGNEIGRRVVEEEDPGIFNFVGLDNYVALINDRIYRKAFVNTFNFAVTAVIGKILLGLAMALTLNEVKQFRRFFRATFMLPWVMPTSLSVLGWLWMFDPQFSVVTHMLRLIGLHSWDISIPWKADPQLAMASVQVVNIWRGTPFFGMMILASLMTVPKELYEAATVDGAGWAQRFWNITLPFILPVLIVAMLFSFVRTMGDFQIVWILTNGGPFDSTQLIATRAYQVAIQGAKETGLGSAVAVSLFPFILPVMVLYLRYLRQEE
jgi:multiple sugar transport system permease protein